MATAAQRQHLENLMGYMEAKRSQLLYPPGDQRTNRDNVSWAMNEQTLDHVLNGNGYWQGDCSEYCSFLLKLAGLWHWSSPGYTGSHLELLPHYTDGRDALVGALVVFGPGTGHHEAMVMKPDPKNGNPVCSSHGAPGLEIATVQEIARFQPAGITYLSIAHL